MSSQSKMPNITKATHDLETDEYLNLKPIEIAVQRKMATNAEGKSLVNFGSKYIINNVI